MGCSQVSSSHQIPTLDSISIQHSESGSSSPESDSRLFTPLDGRTDTRLCSSSWTSISSVSASAERHLPEQIDIWLLSRPKAILVAELKRCPSQKTERPRPPVLISIKNHLPRRKPQLNFQTRTGRWARHGYNSLLEDSFDPQRAYEQGGPKKASKLRPVKNNGRPENISMGFKIREEAVASTLIDQFRTAVCPQLPLEKGPCKLSARNYFASSSQHPIISSEARTEYLRGVRMKFKGEFGTAWPIPEYSIQKWGPWDMLGQKSNVAKESLDFIG